MFGASNQLVAALTFIVIASWLLVRGKSIKIVLFPSIFMLFTSIGALLYQLVGFVKSGNLVLVGVSIVLIALAGMMVTDVLAVTKKPLKALKNTEI